jgi:multidrug efflux pump subunit AcrA (membrane-fusion protein)
LQETYGTTRLIANAVKLANALIQYYQDQFSGHNLSPIAQSNTDLSSLNTFTGKVNTHLSNLLNDVNSLQKDRDAVTTDALSLQKLQAGSDPFDIQSAQLSIEQKQNALQQAQDALANYTIRAPFDGTIANLTIHKGDNVGSTAVGTEITTQDIADLSLNEVDAAKIKTGQKATLTFDAIDGLSLTGIVADVSPLGTVSQGVVSYDVKIAFDAQDPRVKAGMTVNAAIQTGIVQNALSVPSSAIHVQGNSSYVLAFDALPAGADTAGTSAQGGSSSGGQGVVSSISPRQLPVTTGISDDANTEITSGLQVGQTVVARTITGTTQATAASAPSLFGGGGRGLGGGTVRTSGSGGARGN